MNSRPYVHPDVVKYVRERIPSLELSEGESPEELMARAQKRQGMLDLIAILESMSKDKT
jgi:hypothetical protein